MGVSACDAGSSYPADLHAVALCSHLQLFCKLNRSRYDLRSIDVYSPASLMLSRSHSQAPDRPVHVCRRGCYHLPHDRLLLWLQDMQVSSRLFPEAEEEMVPVMLRHCCESGCHLQSWRTIRPRAARVLSLAHHRALRALGLVVAHHTCCSVLAGAVDGICLVGRLSRQVMLTGRLWLSPRCPSRRWRWCWCCSQVGSAGNRCATLLPPLALCVVITQGCLHTHPPPPALHRTHPPPHHACTV
jgi:hypothetical protein